MSRAHLSAVASRVAKLLRMLASEHDGEVIGSARALTRTLYSAGLNFHDLAAVVETGPGLRPLAVPGDLPELPKPWAEMCGADRVRSLSQIERHLRLSSWELQLVVDIKARIMAFPACRQSVKQARILDELVARLWAGEKKGAAR